MGRVGAGIGNCPRICSTRERDENYVPRYLWKPYWARKECYACVHNTDPFIFVKHFLYSNCRQANSIGLWSLDRRSVIAFGNGETIHGKRKWVLDTVLVVHDFVEYDMHDARTALKNWASDTFLNVTGGPLSDYPDNTAPSGACAPKCAPTSPQLRLYRGATPNEPVHGMFSFFPAVPECRDSSFPQPLVDLPCKYFNPKNWRAAKGTREERTLDELGSLWDSLVAQVRSKDVVLGRLAELPKRQNG